MKKIVFVMSFVLLMNFKAQAAPAWLSPGISLVFGLTGFGMMLAAIGGSTKANDCNDNEQRVCCSDEDFELQVCVPQNQTCPSSTQLMCVKKPFYGTSSKTWSWSVVVAGSTLLFSGMIPALVFFIDCGPLRRVKRDYVYPTYNSIGDTPASELRSNFGGEA